MSTILKELRDSSDPLKNDLALVYDHWLKVKRSHGRRASLGFEPRDIRALGPETVISKRVLNASSGFEEVDKDQSYESLVLKYSERFSAEVIAAARKRLKHDSNNQMMLFKQQDIQFFIKTSSINLFGERDVQPSSKCWVGRKARLPRLHKKGIYAQEILLKGFRSLVWLHEQKKEGEFGRGLTALVQFGPMQTDQSAQIYDALFFCQPIGKELINEHKDLDSFISKFAAMRHDRIWPVLESDVDTLFSAVLKILQTNTDDENSNPVPADLDNLEKIDDHTALRKVVLRRFQAVFRQNILNIRPNCCAISGTSEISVLEAAHIIPYAERLADRDRPENGILLRSDIHKLFDAHLISINPETRKVEISNTIECPHYRVLNGKLVSDDISQKSLSFHYKKFQKQHSLNTS